MVEPLLLATRVDNRRSGSDEPGVQGYLRFEQLGYGAVLLGAPSELGESGRVDSRYLRAQRQGRTADTKALPFRIQRYGRLGSELGRGEAGSLKLKRQSHGKATGMSCGDELLRIRAFLILEACFERVRRLCEHARLGGKLTVSRPPVAAPNGCCFANHRCLLSRTQPIASRRQFGACSGGVASKRRKRYSQRYCVGQNSSDAPDALLESSCRRMPARCRCALPPQDI